MNLKPILAAVVIAFPASALAQQAPPTTPPASRIDPTMTNGDQGKAEADKAKAAHLYRQAEHNKDLAKEQWEVANELWLERQEDLDKYHKPHGRPRGSSPPPQRPRR